MATLTIIKIFAVIGILDTGVIPYHPDLGGTVDGLPAPGAMTV